MRHMVVASILMMTLSGTAVLAQGAGGGAGSPQTNPDVAACTLPGPDGKPSRKMSSEEICPMYAFWRDDCTRAGKLGEYGARGHCGPAAMGLRDDMGLRSGLGRREDLTTGSVRPAR